MFPNLSSRRWRAALTGGLLAMAASATAFLYLLIIGSFYFLRLLAGAGFLALLGAVHYVLWGRKLEQQRLSLRAQKSRLRPKQLRPRPMLPQRTNN